VLLLSAGAHLTLVALVGQVDCFGMARDISGNAVLERFMREGSNGEEDLRMHLLDSTNRCR